VYAVPGYFPSTAHRLILIPKYNEPGTAHKLPPTLEQRFAAVTARIRAAELECGRAPGSVALLAVSKTQPAAAVRRLADLGQRRFGESYLQEALEKIADLESLDLEWHFIGRIQSNKTREIATHFAWVHGVDRLKLAQRLNDQRPPSLPRLQVCLQVNIDAEPSKAGVTPAELPALADAVAGLPRLQLRGLMAIPASRTGSADQRRPFAALREALAALNGAGHHLDTLSMGMSRDMEAAIAEGATLVRIGTDLFGPRPPKAG
jgi:pyridoxal phosphate enzyme (YggS family)